MTLSEKQHINQEAIAIIGMACLFPQAPDLQAFWHNILASVNAVGEPSEDWEADRYLDSKRIKTSNGGYLKNLYCFDPKEFGIMPNSLDGGEPDQFMALRVARDALLDAGYHGNGYDHSDTGVVLGHSTYLHRGQGNHIQHHIILDQTLELLHAVFPSLGNDKSREIRKLLETKLPQCNADIAPGLVPNVMTGRIANRLNLKGPNYILDAACSSSLLAVNAAIDELRNGRSRLMLAGGVNASLPAEVSVIFTELGALSKQGKICPFDKIADGTLLGEGLGVVVLKRVSEAINDRDRIYAVIHGVGQASDGKGLGLLAPNIEGETLAISRAYEASGIDPGTIALMEAHGTGIPLGDQTEIAALRNVYGDRQGAQGSVAIGSIKSMISHCIPAAGIAGLIKTALALHHKILPPTICENVDPALGIESTPFYVNTAPRPWIIESDKSRRAGINSFGFGGINTHAILEEAPARAFKPRCLNDWPFELCVFSAHSLESLQDKLSRVENLLKENPDCRPGKIAAALLKEETEGSYRLAMVVKNNQDFAGKIKQAAERLNKKRAARWSTRSGINFSSKPLDGKVAFMFPGEGSQYLGMLTDLALYFAEVRHWFNFWRGLYDERPGESRIDIIFPPDSELTKEHRKKLETRLHDMDVGSEAVFVAGQAMHSLLKSLGVEADVMVGHSTGESSALAASGAIAAPDQSQLAVFIRELNSVYEKILNEGKIPTGALLTVGALSRAEVKKHIAEVDDEVFIAMDNCPNQLVLFGTNDSIEKLQITLSKAGGICVVLPFDRGYHTPLFSSVSEAFLNYYEDIALGAPHIPLYSCSSADLFPDDVQETRNLAAGQWSKPVRFSETVTKMYNDGVRYFIEVGPSGNLSAFINDILAGSEHLILPTNIRRKNCLEQLLIVIAQLFVNKKNLNLTALFESRFDKDLDLKSLLRKKQKAMPLANTMPIIHLSDNDGEKLRNFLPLAKVSDTERETFAGHDLSRDFETDDYVNISADNENIMSGYFELMHEFLEQQRTVMETVGPGAGEIEEVGSGNEYAPFLSDITELDEKHLVGQCYLNAHEDLFLQNHILSGTVSEVNPELFGLSCVPLMVSLEIMAEACALVAGDRAVCLIENVKAFDWIALDDDEIFLDVYAEKLSADRNKFHAHIINSGNMVISAEFSFENDWHVQGVSSLSEKRKYRWEASELYSTGMFHGPLFQSIARIDGWDDTGIDASLSDLSLDGFFSREERPNFILNPVLLDAFGQLAAYWIAQQVGTDFNSFPSTIERIELYRHCPQDIKGVTLRARLRHLDPDYTNVEAPKSWYFDCCDSRGETMVRATGLVNIYYPVPNNFYEFRRDPLNGRLGRFYAAGQNKDIVLWRLDNFSENFCAQSGGIFLRILARALLGFDELGEWRELAEKRVNYQRKWLLGRACLKEAVRYWIYQQTGETLYPSDIIVRHDEDGAPYVAGWWSETLITAPEVSLSHDKMMSVAAVSFSGSPVGVDVEQVGRIQQTDLVKECLNEQEKLMLVGIAGEELDDRLLRFWCAKEAAAKYLGLGLQGQPERYKVSFNGNDWERAQVSFADMVINVTLNRDQNTMLALSA